MILFAAVMLGARPGLRLVSPRISCGWRLDPRHTSESLHLRREQCFRAMAVDGHVHASSSEPKPLNDLFTGLPTTIFTVMTNLAIKHKTINLGQGFPDEEGPEQMKQLIGAATMEHHNQYPPMLGVPELRQAVARHSRTYCGIDVQWDSETLVTVGATEAIAASFLGILNEGDEVLCTWCICILSMQVKRHCCPKRTAGDYV